MLVHGLWGRLNDFLGDDGSPGLSGALNSSRLFAPSVNPVSFARYDERVKVTSSIPTYAFPFGLSGSSLGFQFGAARINEAITAALEVARSNHIAASRVDIVAHSMGGDAARAIAQMPGYRSDANFGVGSIHKLITIGTPHRGSPLATALIQSSNHCVQTLFSLADQYVLTSATLDSGSVFDGAIENLRNESVAIQAIHQGPPLLATAMLGAQASTAQLAGLGSSSLARVIRALCGISPANSSPLALDLDPDDWKMLMGGPSDGIVPYNSELDDETDSYPAKLALLANPSGITLRNAIHSAGTELLGLSPPAELDASSGLQSDVIQLLNTPISSSVFELKP